MTQTSSEKPSSYVDAGASDRPNLLVRIARWMGLARMPGRWPEARLLASDLEYQLALKELELPEAVTAGFSSRRATEQIAAAIELRRRKIEGLEGVELSRALAGLQARYAIAAGPTAALRYRNAPPPTGTSSDQANRVEANWLLENLRLIYTVGHLRDEEVSRLRVVPLALIAGLLLLLLFFSFSEASSPAIFYVQVAVAGAIGSVVSIMERSQAVHDSEPLEVDPIQQISGLRQGYTGLWIVAMTGPVMALVLFSVFAGGLLTIGDLTPRFLVQGPTGEVQIVPAPAAPPQAVAVPPAAATGSGAGQAPQEPSVAASPVVSTAAPATAQTPATPPVAGPAAANLPEVNVEIARRGWFSQTSASVRSASPRGAAAECSGFPAFGWCIRFLSGADAAKMIVWAFLAGFSERLVPDVLNRFVRRSKDEDPAFRAGAAQRPNPSPDGKADGAARDGNALAADGSRKAGSARPGAWTQAGPAAAAQPGPSP